MRKTYWVAVALLLLGMGIFTACSKKDEAKEQVVAETGEKSSEEISAADGLLGEFETVDLQGASVNQDIFAESNLTMLNIWGTFCGPCIREMPDLGELSGEYDKEHFQIVGLISDVGQPKDEVAQEIVDKTKADYTHIINSQELMDGYLGQVQAVPTTVFLDREGKQVGETYTGSRDKDSWKKIIEEVLEMTNGQQ